MNSAGSSSGAIARHRRWWLWLPLLAIAAWLALVGDKSPNGGVAAVSVPVQPRAMNRPDPRPVPRRAAPGSAVKPQSIEMLLERSQLIAAAPAASAAARRDLFSTRNWNPPPPQPPVAAPPPVAPPLPFAYLGKKLEGGSWEVYLSRGEQTFNVREGQALESVWRIDRIAPPSMELTYLPMGQGLALAIGEIR